MKSGAIEASSSALVPSTVPGPLFTRVQLRSNLGIWENEAFDDAELDDLLLQAESMIEEYLETPAVKRRRIEERYADFADALVLLPKRLHGNLGSVTELAITVTTAAADETLPADGYLLDATGERALVRIVRQPSIIPDPRLQAPVLVRYTFEPVVPAAVTVALGTIARELFNGRYAGEEPRLPLDRWLAGLAPAKVA